MNKNLDDFDKFTRAANYLTAAQIFLKDNFLLERPLTFDDIKPRLLGHWGSGPGVNFAYAHLNKMIKKYGISEGTQRWNSYCKKQADSNKFEYKCNYFVK